MGSCMYGNGGGPKKRVKQATGGQYEMIVVPAEQEIRVSVAIHTVGDEMWHPGG